MTKSTTIDPTHVTAGSADSARPSTARQLVRYFGLLAVSLLAAAAIVVAAVRLTPPSEQPPPELDKAGSPALTSAASRSSSASASDAGILLATVPAPATAQQLQDEAKAVATELVARYPDLAEALHVAAMMHAQLRESAEAEKLWTRCIELDAGQQRYYINLAANALDRGDSELAAQTLRQALSAGCSSPDISHHLALALTGLGNVDEAEAVLLKDLAKYPDSAPCWLVLGQTQLKRGKPAEAEASLLKAIGLGARSAEAYFALSNAYARQGQEDEATKYRELFRELKAVQPLDPQTRFQVLSTAEARQSAVSTLSDAATVHGWQQDFLEAERLLHRAIALDPGSSEPCRLLANLYQEAEMFAEEQVVRRRLVQIEPQRAVNCLHLATVSARLGQRKEAEAALKLAVAISPQSPDPYTTLAHFYLEDSRVEHARWYAQEAVRRQPTSEGYVLLGSTCRLLGAEADAQAAFAAARKLSAGPSPAAGKAPAEVPLDPGGKPDR